jgi:hypothetical protein
MRSLSNDTEHPIANWSAFSQCDVFSLIYLISDRLEAASEEDDITESDIQLYIRGEEGHREGAVPILSHFH